LVVLASLNAYDSETTERLREQGQHCLDPRRALSKAKLSIAILSFPSAVCCGRDPCPAVAGSLGDGRGGISISSVLASCFWI